MSKNKNKKADKKASTGAGVQLAEKPTKQTKKKGKASKKKKK